MSDRCDISVAAVPGVRFCVCSTPRSGSTLLCNILKSTGLAGVPDEYLNPLYIEAWTNNDRPESFVFSQYIANLEARRTSANGYFGIKIHWRHLDLGFGKAMQSSVSNPFLARFDKFILIVRKDKLAQAISDFAARRTGVFHSEHERYLDGQSLVEFDEVKITKTICDILAGEQNWINYLTRNNCEYLTIAYEDLVDNYNETIRQIFEFLGLDINIIPDVPDTRMSRKNYAEIRSAWMQKLGLS